MLLYTLSLYSIVSFYFIVLGKSELGEGIRRTGALAEELAELLPLL